MPSLANKDERVCTDDSWSVSSALSLVPILRCPNYCASKAALHHFVLVLREQLKGSKVKIIEIFPPAVQSKYTLHYSQRSVLCLLHPISRAARWEAPARYSEWKAHRDASQWFHRWSNLRSGKRTRRNSGWAGKAVIWCDRAPAASRISRDHREYEGSGAKLNENFWVLVPIAAPTALSTRAELIV